MTDPEDEPGTQDHALPEREGITDNTQSELPPETKVYETDEYVEPTEEDRGSGTASGGRGNSGGGAGEQQ